MSRRARDRSFLQRRHLCESLERRLLLSTINWINKGSPGNDIDSFEAFFGSSAQAARAVVQRAIDDWETVIPNFNRADGSNSYDLLVGAGTLDPGKRATSQSTAFDPNGLPTAGFFTLDDDAGGSTWYFDPIFPSDDAEFISLVAPFAAAHPSLAINDMYSTAAHELGHLMGFTQHPVARINQFVTDTGVDDPNTTDPGTLGLFNVNGGPAEATFTFADPGHLYEGPAIAGRPDIPIHPIELINPGRNRPDNRRVLISDFMATVLQQAYGYSVVMPSTINNMLVQSNHFADILTVEGIPGDVDDAITIEEVFLGLRVTVGGFTEIVPFSETNSITVIGGDGDDLINLASNGGRPTAVNGNSGSDTLVAFPQSPTTLTDAQFTSPNYGTVQYGNLQEIILIGTGGADTFTVQSTSAITPVHILADAGADTLNVNVADLNLLDNGITWNNGDGADVLNLNFGSTTAAIDYEVSTANAVRARAISAGGDFTVTQPGFNTVLDRVNVHAGSSPDGFTIRNIAVRGNFNGNGGNDAFQLGDGDLGFSTAQAVITGGPGNDTLILNDSFHTGTTDWALDDTQVQRNSSFGAQVYPYTGFEGIDIRLGSGGGPGNDVSVFGAVPVNVSVTGGAGVDNFLLFSYANETPFEQLDALFDGGGGFNSLVVNDSSRGTLVYDLYPNRLDTTEALADDSDFDFDNISNMSITASDAKTTLNVFGTHPDIAPGNQTTVFLRNGDDVVNLFPHDSFGNLTVATNIGIAGEGGSDTFTVQDAGSTLPINYTFSNPFGSGTQNIFGMGTGGLGTAGIESLAVNAGNGNDTFAVNQYASGTSLTLSAGGGDDVLDFGNNNLPAFITNISQFIFDGQAGLDTFNLNNANAPGTWQYQHNSNVFTATRTAGGSFYAVTPFPASVEYSVLNAGSGADTLLADGVVTGQTLTFNANDGDDAVNIFSNASVIRGPLFYNAGAGTNRLNQFSNSRFTPITAHLTTTTLGAHPDDTLFTPGGYIQWDAVQVIDLAVGGSAEDTIFATPSELATITLRGGNPVVAPGDSLTLDFSAAVNPVLTPSGSNGGTYTFDNLAPLTYVSFETVAEVALPSWLAPFSVATWDAGTSTLLVTGAATIIADPGLDAPLVTVDGLSAVLTIDAAPGEVVHLGALELLNGASVSLAAGGDRAIITKSLSIAPGGTLDLADNDLILDYEPGTSPADVIEDLVGLGFNGGGWDGTGITSSSAVADPNFVLAVAENATLLQPFGNAEGQGGPLFAGQDVDLSAVLVKFTHRVDLDLDGLVTGNDAAVFNAFFSDDQPTTWQFGDLDYDGLFSGNDAAIFNGFFNESLPLIP